jgi:hypothetical protein
VSQHRMKGLSRVVGDTKQIAAELSVFVLSCCHVSSANRGVRLRPNAFIVQVARDRITSYVGLRNARFLSE